MSQEKISPRPKTAMAPSELQPQGCTHFRLRQLTRCVGQHYDQTMAPTGLKTTQYSLLSHVIRLGPARPGDLARAMKMDASTLTRNLQPLVAHGWIVVGPGSDERCRCVTITEAGRAKHSDAKRVWKLAQTTLNQRLGNSRVLAMHALLEDCLALMNDRTEPEIESA